MQTHGVSLLDCRQEIIRVAVASNAAKSSTKAHLCSDIGRQRLDPLAKVRDLYSPASYLHRSFNPESQSRVFCQSLALESSRPYLYTLHLTSALTKIIPLQAPYWRTIRTPKGCAVSHPTRTPYSEQCESILMGSNHGSRAYPDRTANIRQIVSGLLVMRCFSLMRAREPYCISTNPLWNNVYFPAVMLVHLDKSLSRLF